MTARLSSDLFHGHLVRRIANYVFGSHLFTGRRMPRGFEAVVSDEGSHGGVYSGQFFLLKAMPLARGYATGDGECEKFN